MLLLMPLFRKSCQIILWKLSAMPADIGLARKMAAARAAGVILLALCSTGRNG